jgi:RNA polymerase sigma-70 factor (ECF subfamily)
VPDALVRVAGGQVALVSEVYDLHQRDLFVFALAIVRDRDEADDVVQETFLRLVREVGEGRAPEVVRAWLFTVCANLARGRLRRRSVAGRWRHLLEPRREPAETAEAAAVRLETHEELSRALDSLPPEQRIALLLAAHGFGGEEIAAIIGRSHGATRNVLWRARTSIRGRLDGGGVR